MRTVYFCFQIMLLMLARQATAETLHLTMSELPHNKHAFYVDLIEQSLQLTGHRADIEFIPYTPYMRTLHKLKNGDLSLHSLLKRPKWDREFVQINVGLTNGLIAQRVLLIVPGTQPKYDTINSLEDFQRLKLIGAFGRGWLDVEIWRANQLPYIEIPEWRKIFRMLESGNRGIDYFSRGINEVLGEIMENPKLKIEKRLLFVYDHDFIFYLSPKVPHYRPILEKALLKAKEIGLLDKLIKKHWGPGLAELNHSQRRIIHLKLPEGIDAKFQ